MNERIKIRFTRGGYNLPVAHLEPGQGLILGYETSAKPLGFGIGLAPDNDLVKKSMGEVRDREEWNSDEYHFTTTRDEDTLVVSGAGKHKPKEALPPGRYTLRFRLSETRFRDATPLIEIPESGEAPVQLEEVLPGVRLSVADPAQWDAETRAVCEHPASRIDGMDPLSWLTQPLPRMARKACLMNMLAKARSLPSARPGESFCGAVTSIRWADVDRIDVSAKPELLGRLRALADWRDTGPVDPSHAQNIARIFGGQTSDYSIESFREPVSQRSMQVVVGTQKATGATCAELDIDLGNPQMDLFGLFIHIGELLDPGRTNHLDLYRHLSSGSASDFLYYRLEPTSGDAGS